MKKYALLTAMVLALMVPGVVWGQSTAGGENNGNFQGPGIMSGGQEDSGQQFQEHKAEIIRRLNERLVEVQKRLSCVEGAPDHQALRACMPEKGEGHDNR